MHFAKEMLEVQKQLQKLNHEIFLPITVYQCTEKSGLNENLEFCLKNDVMKDHFKKIEQSEAILVLNYPKNNIAGYIGGSALMEIAVAHHLNKKIFILHDLPSEDKIRYALEIKITRPIILNGDLNKINEY